MNRHLTYASLIGAALMTTAAFAQSSNEPNQPPPPAAQSQANTPAASTGDFVTHQAKDEFRASKLMGVDVYDADNKKIGAIKEVLMDHDGQAKAAVIGVGGFLGIGEKDIAVPFSTLKWETEARNAPAGNTTANPVTTTGGQPKMESVSPAAVEAHQGYPDKAVLNMSLAQLKAAPDFHFAPNPTEASRNAGTTPQTHSNP